MDFRFVVFPFFAHAHYTLREKDRMCIHLYTDFGLLLLLEEEYKIQYILWLGRKCSFHFIHNPFIGDVRIYQRMQIMIDGY